MQCDAIAIRFDAIVCDDATHRHREREIDHVAALPAAGDRRVAFVERRRRWGLIQLQHDRIVVLVGEAIEVARHRLITGPSWNADLDREVAGPIGRDGHLHGAVPRILRRLNDLHVAVTERDVRCAACKQIDVERRALLCVEIAGHRREEARDVTRAARDAEPRTARVLAVRFERVRIEE